MVLNLAAGLDGSVAIFATGKQVGCSHVSKVMVASR